MNSKQSRYNQFYMDMADRVSQMSYAVRKKVGSVLVKNGNVISFGWNGMPAGWDNNCEFEYINPQTNVTELVTRPEVLHSEMNTILKIAKGPNSAEGATLYTTLAPCIDCAKAIYQSGVSEVIYDSEYKDDSGVMFLKKCGVKISRLIE